MYVAQFVNLNTNKQDSISYRQNIVRVFKCQQCTYMQIMQMM